MRIMLGRLNEEIGILQQSLDGTLRSLFKERDKKVLDLLYISSCMMAFFSAGVIAFKVFTWSDFQKMLIKRCEDSDFQQHFFFENPLDDAFYNAANRIIAHHLLAELGSLPGYVNHPDLLNLVDPTGVEQDPLAQQLVGMYKPQGLNNWVGTMFNWLSLNLMILSHAYFKNLGVPFTRSH